LSTRADPGEQPQNVSDLGERGLIERIRRRFPSPPDVLTVGIGDDAAVAPPVRGELQVLTTDALVEGVHFETAYSGFADIGYKALAVNVSDIAAMGATPRLALLSLILPDRLAVLDLEAFLDGFGQMADEAKTVVAGGNITRSPGPLVIDVTVSGSVRPRRILRRSGGRPGDALFVTGGVGSAGAGLGWLRAHAASPGPGPDDEGMAECVRRHRRPEPRL
jgi:thiamine-monophosphate kinase